jgi:hypothetical protein
MFFLRHDMLDDVPKNWNWCWSFNAFTEPIAEFILEVQAQNENEDRDVEGDHCWRKFLSRKK